MSRPPARSRLPALAALALACIALLGACGKGSPPSSTHAAGAPASTATSTRPTPSREGEGLHAREHGGARGPRAQAQAFARAVNLTAGDVPGFSVSQTPVSEPESTAEKRFERGFRKCAGASLGDEAKPLAEASSSTFERKGGIADQSVSSSVSVERSSHSAAGWIAALRNRRLRGCLASAFRALLAGEHIDGAQIGPVSIKYGSPPAPGTSGGYALRVITNITVRRIPVPFYLDVLGFVDGPADVSLLTISIPSPFPAHVEESLFSLLLARAKARTA